MDRIKFLKVLANDIEGLDKYSQFESSKELREKEPEAFNYFISLYHKAYPNGKLDNFEPTTEIFDIDLRYFEKDLALITDYAYISAYKDFYHIQEMKYWLSCKDTIEAIDLIYGEYADIYEVLKGTGYTLSTLYLEMSDIVYDFKKDYRQQLRDEELARKRKEKEDAENKIKKNKEETARKLAELKARKEGKASPSVEGVIDFAKMEKEIDNSLKVALDKLNSEAGLNV